MITKNTASQLDSRTRKTESQIRYRPEKSVDVGTAFYISQIKENVAGFHISNKNESTKSFPAAFLDRSFVQGFIKFYQSAKLQQIRNIVIKKL